MTQLNEIPIRGDFDLDTLENRCGTIQNLLPGKLIQLRKKDDEKKNIGIFERVAYTNVAPRPEIVEVSDPTKIPSIIGEQIAQGRKIIFDSTIYVEQAEKRVLGFR